MKEVELRSFVTQTQAEVILVKLPKLGYEPVSDERQITYYLDTPTDTRVQITSTGGGRVWQKLGKMHDDARVEYNAPMQTQSAEAMVAIFKNMGFGFKVAWLRHRREFKKNNLTLTVDNTHGYGWIVEVETLCEEGATEAGLKKVKTEFENLGLDVTPKAKFDEAFSDYMKNWEERVEGELHNWLEHKNSAV